MTATLERAHFWVGGLTIFMGLGVGAMVGSALEVQEATRPLLSILEPSGGGWVRLGASGPTSGVYRLETSSNLVDWAWFGQTHDALVAYPDPGSTNSRARFYRAFVFPETPTNDWKNQIHFPEDPFRSAPMGLGPEEIRWIKFAILLSDPVRVFYQDSQEYLFHYDFAVQRLPPFLGMTPAEFDQVSLHVPGQQALLGTVLYPPAPNVAEYGIQLVGLDHYPREMVRAYFELVRATVVSGPGVQAFYVPTFEQSRVAETNREYFATHGIAVSSTGRWLQGDQCYAAGWAVGRLKFFAGSEIAQAYGDGRLQPGDILLTDTVPSEVPFLAGVIALEPSTPNSHVAILSRSYGIPFVHLVDQVQRAQAQGLVGRRIALRAIQLYDRSEISLIDLEDALTPALEAEILDLKRPPLLQITPKAPWGAFSAPTDSLRPADIRYFGGKAANFGFLRREIPTNSQPAIAFSFDLWDAFLDQWMSDRGSSLRVEIFDRLGGYSYPPDVAALRFELAAVRDRITDVATFTPDQQHAIIAALGVFDSNRKIRFRSSTNVEDTENFTGAGLYDSYSGCLLDDLDGDTRGPSLCDASEANERGVFRAIKKVYASFYNDNAFLERLRLGVDEGSVGMAVLAHHSFPDDIELANGVATLDISPGTSHQMHGDLVTQEGAVPVTNPDGTALPEVVNASRYSFGTFLNLKQRSSLVPLGDYVLEWDAEYRGFMDLFARVADGYAREFPAKRRFVLDFEYKKVVPAHLEVKQVRELPLLDTTNTVGTFLLNESNRFCVFQGEFGDVFANHRLKSLWALSTESLRLAETNLARSFYANASWEYVDGAQITNLTGAPSSWNKAGHAVNGDEVTDGWTLGDGLGSRRFELITYLVRQVRASECPLFTLADLDLQLQVRYAVPMPGLDYMGNPALVTNEVVRLIPCPVVRADSLFQDRVVGTNGIVVHSTFYWPKEPTGAVAGYTAPLVDWVETTITGLISQPIVLHGHYSQTYRPGHHNFSEEFIFEPRLEPGLAPALLGELEVKNIQLLHMSWRGYYGAPFKILGLDGRFRAP